ncbi:MAG TPA: LuxR C-terminal-related transcriptional regulator, partial [Ktedonobacterales bacterium]|nr:LuxR C-terminal-related transcriptional regulator [Ktedonobacterales bacterium]
QENIGTIENNGFARALIGMRAWLCYGQGRLHQAEEYFQRMLAEARQQGDLSDIGPAMSGLAHIAYEWNDLQTALEQVQTTLKLYQHPADIFDARVATQLTLLSIRIQHAQGRISPAQQQLAELLTHLRPEGLPAWRHLYREARYTQAALQLAIGDIAAAQRWTASRVQDDTLPFSDQLQEAIIEARLFIVLNRHADALDHLTRLLETTQQAENKPAILMIQLLMAVAQASHKQMPTAQAMIKDVLEQARTEGYMRLFLNEGDRVASLLATLDPHIHDKALKAYLHRILNAFTAARTGQPDYAQTDGGGLVEPLSAQELRVLRLLVVGRTNAEIAGELIVSVNTIRTHVQRIFRKLNVHNRVGAGEAARRHHLS